MAGGATEEEIEAACMAIEWEDPRDEEYVPIKNSGCGVSAPKIVTWGPKRMWDYADWYVERYAEVWTIAFGTVTLILATAGLAGWTETFPDRSAGFVICNPTPDGDLNPCFTGEVTGNEFRNVSSTCGNLGPFESCGCFTFFAAYDYHRPYTPGFSVLLSLFIIDLISCTIAIVGLCMQRYSQGQHPEHIIHKVIPPYEKYQYILDVLLLPVVTILTLVVVILALTSSPDGYEVTKTLLMTPERIEPNSNPDPPSATTEMVEVDVSKCTYDFPNPFPNEEEGCKERKIWTIRTPPEGRISPAINLQDANPPTIKAVLGVDNKEGVAYDDTPDGVPYTAEDCVTNDQFYGDVKESLDEGVSIGLPLGILTLISFYLDWECVRRRGKKHDKWVKKQRKALRKEMTGQGEEEEEEEPEPEVAEDDIPMATMDDDKKAAKAAKKAALKKALEEMSDSSE